jgi:hypothetical protein
MASHKAFSASSKRKIGSRSVFRSDFDNGLPGRIDEKLTNYSQKENTMTVQTETARVGQNPTGWQTVKRWLVAIDEGVNCDPHLEAARTIRQLWQKQAELETRVSKLEVGTDNLTAPE